ncbi:hypothetical protein [uncultured Aquabacterium sp.]|nr:hypothetical protein [uncultured Aquabacterium sp.]MCH2242664.1 hypothetical protein [Aquabacterium sp.]
MKCQRYVFLLSSGQLTEAPLASRLEASAHRWMCHRCRAFTRNNDTLDHIMAAQRDRLMQPDSSDPPGVVPGEPSDPGR